MYFINILQVIKTELQNDRFFSKKNFFPDSEQMTLFRLCD